MAEADANKLRFRPRARIIRTIGDQLISGPEAAVIELVKNAYDADATKVTITFVPPLEPGRGRIVVQDDGHGMSLSDIQDKWMEPATTSKVRGRRSPGRNRLMMGYKGIGRFAAAKLGLKMSLLSVSEREGVKHEVLIPELDWDIFNGDTYLSDIAIQYLQQETIAPTGTTLEIGELTEGWPEAKLNRLLLELRRLLSPLDQQPGGDEFEIFLDLSACTAESTGFSGIALLESANAAASGERNSCGSAFQVQPFPLLTACDYEVHGTFDVDGAFSGTFQNHRAGSGPETIELSIPFSEEEESCGPVEVRLFVFDREAAAVKANMQAAGLGDLPAARARTILDQIAGVAIYRSGFRVRPYGDSHNDWLSLDRRRVQNPSVRIGHNQVAGYVTVADQENSNLLEKSSREGFEENGAFLRLHRLVEELLTREVEPRRYRFRSKAGLSRTRQVTFEEVRRLSELQKVRQLLGHLEPAERAEAESLLDAQTSLLTNRIDQLEERQRILEAKSSLGAIIAEVLHEGAGPAIYVSVNGAMLRSRMNDLMARTGPRAKEAEDLFRTRLPNIAEAGDKLASLFRNLRPLAGGKRGPPQTFNAVNVIRRAMALFEQHAVPVEIFNPDRVTDLIGYPDDLATAMVNLIGNAVHWLEDSRTEDPKVLVTIRGTPEEAVIWVQDNGPGVTEEFAELIFDVGFSLKTDGTGLGLNIAKEALVRSDATLAYHMDFREGARFEIRFPRVREGA
ncbi:MAG TPA: sensor histidine kinase [Allosphingosinicella sp.]|jgi:signal transduction histidine kinase